MCLVHVWVDFYQSKFELVMLSIYSNDLHFPLGQSAGGIDVLLYYLLTRVDFACLVPCTKYAVSAVNVVCHALRDQ